MHIQTERELSAAGFQMKLADTAEQRNHLSGLPQTKLFPTRKDGSVVYVYADIKGCKCVYVGSEADYQSYQRISLQQEAVNAQRQAAADVQMAEMNWGVWGPWRRPIL